jgi:hypothetical protein
MKNMTEPCVPCCMRGRRMEAQPPLQLLVERWVAIPDA